MHGECEMQNDGVESVASARILPIANPPILKYTAYMFHHQSHFAVWHLLQKHLKKGDFASVASVWQEYLPSLAENYDELRMLYYLGRFGARAPYKAAAQTLAYLHDSPPDILQYRLAIFRYTVENATVSDPAVSTWMIHDLAEALNIPHVTIPAKKLPMPDALNACLLKINPLQKSRYEY